MFFASGRVPRTSRALAMAPFLCNKISSTEQLTFAKQLSSEVQVNHSETHRLLAKEIAHNWISRHEKKNSKRWREAAVKVDKEAMESQTLSPDCLDREETRRSQPSRCDQTPGVPCSWDEQTSRPRRFQAGRNRVQTEGILLQEDRLVRHYLEPKMKGAKMMWDLDDTGLARTSNLDSKI